VSISNLLKRCSDETPYVQRKSWTLNIRIIFRFNRAPCFFSQYVFNKADMFLLKFSFVIVMMFIDTPPTNVVL
jgi:hypothetical protein